MRKRLAVMAVFPAIVLLWMLGWVMCSAGSRQVRRPLKENEREDKEVIEFLCSVSPYSC